MDISAPELLALLKNPKIEARIQAVRRFSELARFHADLFVRALGDEDWRVRKEAAMQFILSPQATSQMPFLVDQLAHPENAGLRNAAIEILIGLGATAVPELIKRIATSDAEVRKFIVDILGEIGHPSCVTELLPCLQDADDNVRYAVVETFGKLKAEAAVNALLDLLESADTGLRFAIFEALAAIGVGVPVERIVPFSEDRLLRKAVFSCFGSLGDVQALPVLIAGVADPLPKIRETALLAVGKIIKGLPAETPLPPVAADRENLSGLVGKYLEHEDLNLRRAACYALSLWPEPESLWKVLPLLDEEELRSDVVAACRRQPQELILALTDAVAVTDESAQYLVFLGGELQYRSIIPLAQAGLTAVNPQLRHASALSLGKVAATETIPLLGDALLDPVDEIREAAANSLQLLGRQASAEVIRTLVPYLESNDAALRILAVRILATLPTDQVEEALLLALKDVDPDVRCEALRSLKGGVSQRLLNGLSLALTDEVADVRRLAAEAMASFSSPQALSILGHAADDPDPWVRMAAIRSLQKGDDDELEAIVTKGLNDEVGLVIIAALESAARLLPNRAEGYLLKALVNPDRDVVATAVRLLLAEGWAEKLLTHESAQVRLAVIMDLERQDEAIWRDLFTSRLACEDVDEVRTALGEALRRGRAGA